MATKRRPRSDPPAEEAQPPELGDAELERFCRDIIPLLSAGGKRSVRARAEVGRVLLQVRERLSDGAWRSWLSAQLPLTATTADRTIRLFELASSDPLRLAQLAPLGVAKVYALLTLDSAIVDQLLAGAHTVPSTGADKTLLRMTCAELAEVVAALDPESATRFAAAFSIDEG